MSNKLSHARSTHYRPPGVKSMPLNATASRRPPGPSHAASKTGIFPGVPQGLRKGFRKETIPNPPISNRNSTNQAILPHSGCDEPMVKPGNRSAPLPSIKRALRFHLQPDAVGRGPRNQLFQPGDELGQFPRSKSCREWQNPPRCGRGVKVGWQGAAVPASVSELASGLRPCGYDPHVFASVSPQAAGGQFVAGRGLIRKVGRPQG